MSFRLKSFDPAWRKLSNFRATQSLLFDLALIVGAISGGVTHLENFGVVIVSILLIGSRQHSLLVLAHEAAHSRLFSNQKWNNGIARVIALLFLGSFDSYRADHLQHHLEPNSDLDTSWTRKTKASSFRHQWEFPRSRASMVTLVARDLLGLGIFYVAWWMFRVERGHRQANGKSDLAFRLLVWTAIAVVLTRLGIWTPVGLFWFLPMVTVLRACMRVRSISEHYGLSQLGRYDEFSRSRSVLASPLERFFFYPNHVNFHVEHHIYPQVPFYSLPKVHAQFVAEMKASGINVEEQYTQGVVSLLFKECSGLSAVAHA